MRMLRADKPSVYIIDKGNVMKSGRARRLLLLLLLLRTFGRELPDIGSYQEVHHRLIAHLHNLMGLRNEEL